MIEHLVTPNDRIILELTRYEIEFVAAVAHLFLQSHPENSTVNGLIKNLVEQTDYVSSNPKNHGISSELCVLRTTQEQWGLAARGLDMSGLSNLLYQLEQY